jgi:hypothetical protein
VEWSESWVHQAIVLVTPGVQQIPDRIPVDFVLSEANKRRRRKRRRGKNRKEKKEKKTYFALYFGKQHIE